MWRHLLRGLTLALAVGAIASCGKTRRDSDEPVGSGGSPPVATDGPQCAVDLASGDAHHCAVYDDGSAWCWGRGTEGQLGDGSVGDSHEPVSTGLGNVLRIEAGQNHTCALDSDRSIWCWGDNTHGQAGERFGVSVVGTPLEIEVPGQSVQDLALSSTQTCVLDLFFHVYCWGMDASGRGSTPPVQVTTPELGPVVGLFGGDDSMFVAAADGRLFDISTWDSPVPVQLGAGNFAVTESSWQTCVLKRSGTVWCSKPSPQMYGLWESGKTAAQVGVGDAFMCARLWNGTVECEGSNRYGQLGDGSLQDRAEPVAVLGIEGAFELSVGRDSACALTSAGKVDCWGLMPWGEGAPYYVEVSGCHGVAFALPPPPPPPPPTPADRFEEAGLAYGDAMCACGFGRDTPNFASCLVEESHVRSSACLRALAPEDSGYYDCRASDLWEAAGCMAANCSKDGVLDCVLLPSDCGGPALQGVVSYCSARLPCGLDAMPRGEGLVCNGIADCEGGTDELNCTPGQGVFNCADGTTVQLAEVCDGRASCPDMSDELGCI